MSSVTTAVSATGVAAYGGSGAETATSDVLVPIVSANSPLHRRWRAALDSALAEFLLRDLCGIVDEYGFEVERDIHAEFRMGVGKFGDIGNPQLTDWTLTRPASGEMTAFDAKLGVYTCVVAGVYRIQLECVFHDHDEHVIIHVCINDQVVTSFSEVRMGIVQVFSVLTNGASFATFPSDQDQPVLLVGDLISLRVHGAFKHTAMKLHIWPHHWSFDMLKGARCVFVTAGKTKLLETYLLPVWRASGRRVMQITEFDINVRGRPAKMAQEWINNESKQSEGAVLILTARHVMDFPEVLWGHCDWLVLGPSISTTSWHRLPFKCAHHGKLDLARYIQWSKQQPRDLGEFWIADFHSQIVYPVNVAFRPPAVATTTSVTASATTTSTTTTTTSGVTITTPACVHCMGTGQRMINLVHGDCPACDGTGETIAFS